MNAIPSLLESAQTRTLANALLDIQSANRKREAADRMCRQSAVGSESEEHWSGRYAEADDLLSDLQTEATAMVEAACGVPWEQIYEALA
jgi:hypothetical protein